jgi:ferredoxin-NADP reductase
VGYGGACRRVSRAAGGWTVVVIADLGHYHGGRDHSRDRAGLAGRITIAWLYRRRAYQSQAARWPQPLLFLDQRPDETRDRYTIAVNRDVASRGGSAYIAEKLKPGDVLTVDPPHNTFPMVAGAELSAFFAGGIGITPVLAMIRHLERLGQPWKLFYAARNRASAAFVAELEALEVQIPGRVHFHFDDEAGKVMPLLKLAAGIPKAAHVYCCGPGKMIEIFKASAGWRPQDNVHVEHFAGTNARPTTAFTVVLKRQGKEFHVPAGESIMQVLMDNGIAVAHSCREGVCGTCETRVLEGVPDHKDNVLSPRERESNTLIMTCCSGAKTERLVLDI